MKDEYQSIITAALPNAMVVYVDNYDDYYCGFSIAPKPGELIRFKYGLNGSDAAYLIKIELFEIWPQAEELQVRRIYSGHVPMLPSGVIDALFLTTLLKNYHYAGR